MKRWRLHKPGELRRQRRSLPIGAHVYLWTRTPNVGWPGTILEWDASGLLIQIDGSDDLAALPNNRIGRVDLLGDDGRALP
jgi:hypothetical protein